MLNTMVCWLGFCHGNDSFTESLVQFFYSFTCTLPPLPLPLCSRLAVDYLILNGDVDYCSGIPVQIGSPFPSVVYLVLI